MAPDRVTLPGMDIADIRPGSLRAALEAGARRDRPLLVRWPGAVLSPHLNTFADAVLAMADDPAVVGATVSLPRFRPQTDVPFVPVEDGADTLCLRVPPDAAALFSPAQAERALANWQGDGDDGLIGGAERSGGWLIAPRSALGYGKSRESQRLLAAGARAWRIAPPAEALAVYDRALEIAPDAARRIAPALAGHEFVVDLWGDRPATVDLLLSSRPCRAPLLGFALELTPPEANLVHPVADGFFSLGHARDFGAMTAARRETLFRHATRYNALGDYAAQFARPLRRLAGRRR